MARTPVIELKNVTKKYVLGTNEIDVLKGVSLEIFAGEYIIFFGPSGSGKSTILNTLCGLEPPTTGEVIVRGDNIAKYNEKELAKYRRDKIGIVFQQFNLIKSFKVWENVAFPLSSDGVPIRRRKDRALKILSILGLEKMAFRRPMELSGGQQQRVAIARALATNAWIIIADEPTGNLDSRSADDVMTIFRLLNQKSRRTVIMVTHNPDYLKEADRVYYVRDGLIAKEERKRHTSESFDEVKDIEDLKSLVFHDDARDEKKDKKKKK
ncbi:MAG: putative ABC transporter ATP-binding protein [bacterium ADurb.Bin400]|nr:MAG: putative ABC transporter ATP-binding protein [bacterium ADurb.Bin400]